MDRLYRNQTSPVTEARVIRDPASAARATAKLSETCRFGPVY
jgi:hypothetical protein